LRGFRPLLNCHVMTAADTTSKVAASKHVYMYRSMMWYKRGRGVRVCKLMAPRQLCKSGLCAWVKELWLKGGGVGWWLSWYFFFRCIRNSLAKAGVAPL
jgi:hypothetical protein